MTACARCDPTQLPDTGNEGLAWCWQFCPWLLFPGCLNLFLQARRRHAAQGPSPQQGHSESKKAQTPVRAGAYLARRGMRTDQKGPCPVCVCAKQPGSGTPVPRLPTAVVGQGGRPLAGPKCPERPQCPLHTFAPWAVLSVSLWMAEGPMLV